MRGRRRRVRIAVGTDRVVVILPDGGVVLLDEVGYLQDRLAKQTGRHQSWDVDWVILPPLVDVRSLEVPPLKPQQTTTALERHASRYFPAALHPQVVAWRAVGRPRGTPVRLVAAAAPEGSLAQLRAELHAAGLRPSAPTPATEAWVAAAKAAVPALVDGAVLVADQDHAVAIAVRAGGVADTAMLPARAFGHVADRIRRLADGGPVVILGAGDARVTLETSLRSGSVSSDTSTLDLRNGPSEDAAVLAARHAGSGVLALVSAGERQAVMRRERRVGRLLWAVAALLFLLAGAFKMWGVHRELKAVQVERADLHAEVTVALAGMQRLEDLQSTVLVLDSLERSAPAWAGLVVELTEHLPRHAHLSMLRAGSDKLIIEGVATDATSVFAALRRVHGVRDVNAQNPIRRERWPGRDEAAEHFSLAARLNVARGADSGHTFDSRAGDPGGLAAFNASGSGIGQGMEPATGTAVTP